MEIRAKAMSPSGCVSIFNARAASVYWSHNCFFAAAFCAAVYVGLDPDPDRVSATIKAAAARTTATAASVTATQLRDRIGAGGAGQGCVMVTSRMVSPSTDSSLTSSFPRCGHRFEYRSPCRDGPGHPQVRPATNELVGYRAG